MEDVACTAAEPRSMSSYTWLYMAFNGSAVNCGFSAFYPGLRSCPASGLSKDRPSLLVQDSRDTPLPAEEGLLCRRAGQGEPPKAGL